MKQLYNSIILVFAIVFISGCASYAPKTNDLTAILVKTNEAITQLEKKISTSTDQELINSYNQLNQKHQELFPLLEKCNEKYALTTEYLSTLRETQKILANMDKNFDQIMDKIFMLNAIFQDYEAKLQTIKNTAQNDATTKIKVVVSSGQEEGFFVFGKLSFEKEQEIKRFRFNQPTQNASQDFVPGYYLFWLEKDNRVSEPELHLIMSNNGEEEKTLVLATPKE